MNEEPIPQPSPGLKLSDIYYVLFRHKWKIILIPLLGAGIAASLPFVVSRPFQSEAKIFVRYVLETQAPAQMSETDSRVRSTDQGAASVINSEIAILSSLDAAQHVADAIGPAKILGQTTGPEDRIVAAKAIRDGLMVAANGSVIDIKFQHPNRALVQPVLDELVETYFRRHAEVHRAIGVFDDFLTRETDQLRSRLIQTENALRAAKTNAGVISIEESRRIYNEELSRIRMEIFQAEAELAQRKATIDEMTRFNNFRPNIATNTATEAASLVVPPEKIAEFRRISTRLDGLIERERELVRQFTPENAQVKSIQEQIAVAQAARENLEEEFPSLATIVVPETRSSQTENTSQFDLQMEMATVTALSSRIKALTNQMELVKREAAAVDSIEGSIIELQRKKELEEANYKYYAAKLEESRIHEALGAGRVSNISTIQAPSPPFRDNEKLIKIMGGICAGSVALALALAFFIELYLDPSVRRPSQVRSHIPAPLFISIPRKALNGKQARNGARQLAGPANGADVNGSKDLVRAAANGNGAMAPWENHHPLRPFFETLRDRLITYFEKINLTHKPKLVAVTSCGEGAGVTTTAAGLAACLSETGEGNVLLVDMNLRDGAAHHFYKGNLDMGIDEVLQTEKRSDALVQENLYVVSEAGAGDGEKLPQVLPKRFKHLVPKLRASDYDYIIFDMPPINEISATPRLAQFMDMVFLVVESEKTSRELAKQATALLSESKTNVGVVLNKTKPYVPQSLLQDI